MRIIGFKGTRVHGFFDYEMEFNKGLTFLTGANGSGKTTILNSIEALLMPRLDFLVLNAFDTLELKFHYMKEKTTLIAKGGEGETTITCSAFPDQEFVIDKRIISEFLVFEMNSISNSDGFYKRLQRFVLDGMKENEIYRFIRSLPKPAYLGLERRNFTFGVDSNREEEIENDVEKILGIQFKDGLTSALNMAKSAIVECYRKRSELDKKLIGNLLDVMINSINNENGKTNNKKISINVLNSHRIILSDLFEKINNLDKEVKREIKSLIEHIKKQIDLLEEIFNSVEINSKKSITIVDYKNISYFNKNNIIFIEKLSNFFIEYYKNSSEIFRNVDGFINAINSFLSDIGKEISYDGIGNLQCNFISKSHGSIPLSSNPLSSGERQLVVVLSNLYFNPNIGSPGILMIDEPEQSLHVLWQEYLVDALLETPSKNQIVLATHSPVIFMHRRDYCKIVTHEFVEAKNEKIQQI